MNNIKIEEEEQWKDIPGFVGYEASTLGRVRNKNSLKILGGSIIISGYVKFHVGKSTLAHRLIASTWIPNPENKPTVNHKNSIRHDNRAENLEWATHKEQNNQTANTFNNKKSGSALLILQYDLNNNFIREFESIVEAGKTLTNHKQGKKLISNYLNNVGKSNGGFIWKYKFNANLENEIWVNFTKNDIDGFSISNYGRIKRYEKIFNLNPSNGYFSISIGNSKNKNTYRINRLVAEYFISNPENKPYVNHKDGDKLNNHVDNLEWCTTTENNQHAINTGLTNHKKVLNFDENNNILGIYNNCNHAGRELNLHPRSLMKCCHGTRKNLKGFYFKYQDDTDDLLNMKISDRPILKITKNLINNQKEETKINVYKNHILIDTCFSYFEIENKYNVNYSTIKNQCEGFVKYPKGIYSFKYF